MKNIIKILSLSLVAVILIVLFASCGLSMEDVEGYYVGSYTEDGSTYTVKIKLTQRGTYGKKVYQDDILISSVANNYELDGKQVVLYSSADHTAYTVYDYTNGKLQKDGHIFTQTIEEDTNELV